MAPILNRMITASKGEPIRLLVVDDEYNIRELLKYGLSKVGFAVRAASNGRDAVIQARQWRPEVILLDLMMPVEDGMTVLPQLRRFSEAPILILTAKGDLSDKIKGLDSGADQYINKPFELDELAARIRSALRRPALATIKSLHFQDLEADLETRSVRRGQTPIRLSTREFDLLVALLRHPRHVFTRDQLLDIVWGGQLETSYQNVETYICYLRQKIDRGFSSRLLHTIRGVGYSLREETFAG